MRETSVSTAIDGYRLSETEDREVYDAIENLYVLDRSQRRWLRLGIALPIHSE